MRPTAASATDAHCTHPRCARARVRMREPGVRRTAFDKNGYNERAAYLPYDPPTPHPRLDCPERLYQPNPYRQSKRRRTGLAANFDGDVIFHSKQTTQNKTKIPAQHKLKPIYITKLLWEISINAQYVGLVCRSSVGSWFKASLATRR